MGNKTKSKNKSGEIRIVTDKTKKLWIHLCWWWIN